MIDICKTLFHRGNKPEDSTKAGDMEDNIRIKLSVKPDTKVCLFHARKDLLAPFMKGDLKLTLDWAENECDTIVYWLRPQDDLKDIASHLQQQIKPSGRIWMVVRSDEGAPKEAVENIQEQVTEYTNLLKGKVVSIGEGESAVQFVIRKDAREVKE
jgi:hypothetical protein